ncbi:MAG: PfkB family carbohydrate kinase, partial [Chloroflexi bacterium]|nr:PfkB family carbohydrate kinase [Chloroflexota bacterium]
DRILGARRYMSHEIKLIFDARIVGQAATVLTQPLQEKAPPRLALDLIDAVEPGTVLVIAVGGERKEIGAWGGWPTCRRSSAVGGRRLQFRRGGSARRSALSRDLDDEFGRCLLDLWSREGIDASRVAIDAERYTGIYFICLLGDGGHDFTYYRSGSAASQLRPQDLDYVADARVLHVSGITQAISRSACDACFAAMDAAHQAGRLVSYDPNVRLKLWSRDTARSRRPYAEPGGYRSPQPGGCELDSRTRPTRVDRRGDPGKARDSSRSSWAPMAVSSAR